MRYDADDVRDLALRALDRGAKSSSWFHAEWDLAGNCTAPVPVEKYGRPNDKWAVSGWATDKARNRSPFTVTMETRCRRCEACLKARAARWRLRAQAELACAPRTWFGTLTLSPDAHYRALSQARARLATRAVNMVDLTSAELFAERVISVNEWITLWLKRVRKNSGATIRYMIVCEAHKSGLPHFHLLLHEQEGLVRHAVLKRAWTYGFSDFRLTAADDRRAAAYVTKYLTKSVMSRVRASIDYGVPSVGEHPLTPAPVGVEPAVAKRQGVQAGEGEETQKEERTD